MGSRDDESERMERTAGITRFVAAVRAFAYVCGCVCLV